MQKNGYTFTTVYSSKCVTVFLNQTLVFHFLVQNWQEIKKENFPTFLMILRFCTFYGQNMQEKVSKS